MNQIKNNIKKIIIGIIACVLIYIAANVIAICNYSKEYSEKMSDVAIVLGAECSNDKVSEVYKQRLNHAMDLYNRGKVKVIITTGGIGEENSIADATVAKNYLIQCGVPEEVVLEETTSTITQENLENAKELMDCRNLKSALIVSDPLHMKRAMLLSEDVGIDSLPSPTGTSAYKTLKTKIPFVARETFFYIGYKWYRVFIK